MHNCRFQVEKNTPCPDGPAWSQHILWQGHDMTHFDTLWPLWSSIDGKKNHSKVCTHSHQAKDGRNWLWKTWSSAFWKQTTGKSFWCRTVLPAYSKGKTWTQMHVLKIQCWLKQERILKLKRKDISIPKTVATQDAGDKMPKLRCGTRILFGFDALRRQSFGLQGKSCLPAMCGVCWLAMRRAKCPTWCFLLALPRVFC